MSTPISQFAPVEAANPEARSGATYQWQIPLMVLASGLLVVAVLRMRPPEIPLTFEERLTQLRSLLTGGLHNLAVQDAGQLLADPALQAGQAAVLHQLIAEATYQAEADRRNHNADNAQGILRSLAMAEENGWVMTGDDWRISGAAWEWLGRTKRALEDYRRAIESDVADPLPLKQHIVELESARGNLSADELLALVDDLIASAKDDPGAYARAVRTKVELLSDQERFDEAEEAIASAAAVLENRSEKRRLDYCSAWVLYRQQRFDEAERALRALRSRLERTDDVYAQSGWLLGEINLLNDRPVEAMSFYQDILGAFPLGVYRAACLLGAAESQARLQEHKRSANLYETLIATFPFEFDSDLIDENRVRSSLTSIYESLRNRGAAKESLIFIELAERLTREAPPAIRAAYLERLAWAQVAAAESYGAQIAGHEIQPHEQVIEEPRDAAEPTPETLMRGHFAAAAESFRSLASVVQREEERLTEALWMAADYFDRAGETQQTIDVLSEFVQTRGSSSRLPLALLRLGQSYQSVQEYPNAIDAYSRNLNEFARTPPAIGSVVPLAECYLAMGEEYFEQAEQVLLDLLNQSGDDPATVTPKAQEYRRALFLLGEMYVRAEEHEKAIQSFEETMARYPDAPESGVARFLLADSYRRSCQALRAELERAEAAAFSQRLESEIARRLSRAHDLFAEVVQGVSKINGADQRLRPDYARLALFYQADCLFDLGRYEQALPLYEEAAWRYHDDPASLSAYVQVLNSYQRMGRHEDAWTALQRAKQLVNRIPEERFTLLSAGMTRSKWENYLGRVADSTLFE